MAKNQLESDIAENCDVENYENEKCPVCGEGFLTAKIRKNKVAFKGIEKLLDLHYSTCSICESDIGTEEQVKLNKNLMLEFQNEVKKSLKVKNNKKSMEVVDTRDALEEFYIDDYSNEDFNEKEKKQSCEHQLKYLYPGQGRYDVYKCDKCNETITKLWNESSSLSYKDRI